MFTSTKVRAALAALVISATALSGAATATAAGKADTKVSIKGDNGDYYGYVKSSDTDCANEREVKVFKQLGSSQDPKHDLKIGTDTAQPNGVKYMWSTGNTGYKHGKFYAKVGKTQDCKGATSKTIKR
jgi:uncharacterized membrane protein